MSCVRSAWSPDRVPEESRSAARRAFLRYHSPRYLHPDPLELVADVQNPAEREVTAFICASLALGRVGSILTTCRRVLEALPYPARQLAQLSETQIRRRLRGFVYRFFGEAEISSFLLAIGAVLREWGSLEACFATTASPADATVLPGLTGLVAALRERLSTDVGILLADPARNSATKRLHLFLRWMVRQDCLDPGGWHAAVPAQLIVPLDVHMLSVCRRLAITRRATASRNAALEITEFFKTLDPSDPVKYDFSLTRYGINPEVKAHLPEDIPFLHGDP